MFANCTSLTYLDISSFDISGVPSIEYTFYNCKSLKSLELKN